MRVMKFSVVTLKLAAVFLISACGAGAAMPALGEEPLKEIERLMESRTAVCWFDGDMVGDIAVNARGRMTFLYVDSKLAGAISRQRRSDMKSGNAQRWIRGSPLTRRNTARNVNTRFS